jgi:hypothetical protein
MTEKATLIVAKPYFLQLSSALTEFKKSLPIKTSKEVRRCVLIFDCRLTTAQVKALLDHVKYIRSSHVYRYKTCHVISLLFKRRVRCSSMLNTLLFKISRDHLFLGGTVSQGTKTFDTFLQTANLPFKKVYITT